MTDKEKAALEKRGLHVESMETLKRVMTPLFFSGQILNDPLDDELIEFKRDWIIHFERTPELMAKLQEYDAIMSVDPAFRMNQTNDSSGIVVTKRDTKGLIYVLEAAQFKVNPKGLIDEIFRLVGIYKPRKVLIETVSAQVMLLDLLRNRMSETGIFFTVEETKTSTLETKTMRVRGLIPYYANGQVLHAKGLNELESQLLEFPRGLHDDILDALSYHQAGWRVVKLEKTGDRSDKPYTWNWWMKQPVMGKRGKGNLKQLFSDLLPQ